MFLPDASERAELVEVVRLGDDQLVAIWEGDSARSALALIAGVPHEELKRCFVPGWMIRAHGDAGPLFEIEFCFRCDGALLRGPAVPEAQRTIHGFDAQSAQAQELLARFRSEDPA
ncbi:hypothetical protein [Allokutzneria sp. NRRL B-24872]|uniref:hypothetical protein n=1 Tax=Allokutzneria sp. NRRL B-24872 TaxID=1137961 RepID=UPI000A3BE176|nr:hypothetical protein [Allokutzneria sp. NRRL B-24872]